MNRILFFYLVLCFSLLFTGCSSGSTNTASAAVGSTSFQGGITSADSGQYTAIQLAVGTLKLGETDYPIDAKQASNLLPLWKAARSLGKNDTVATQELNALLDQIKGSMTSDQWKAIQSMGSSTEDFLAIAQELGLQVFSTGQFGSLPSDTGSGDAQAPATGGMPGDAGGPPDGGAPPDAGAPASSSTGSQSSQSLYGDSGSFMGLSQTLLDAVIQYLETKV